MREYVAEFEHQPRPDRTRHELLTAPGGGAACGRGAPRRGGNSTARGEVAGLLPAALLVLAGAAYLWEIVSLSGIPVARDMQLFFVPQKQLLWEAYRAGEVPLWTPYIGTGAPLHANLQSGFFYPPHWLYALLPFAAAFNLLLAFHFILGGVFAYLLCRRLGTDRNAAWIGAATWMLGGYFASLLNLVNALQAAAWVPALSWAALRVLEPGARHPVAVLTAVACCAGLAGAPQTALLGAICAGLVLWTHLWRRPGAATALRRGVPRLGLALLFAAGLAMVHLLPALEFVRASNRGEGLPLEQAAAYGLSPVRLIHLLVPADYRDPEYAFGLRSILGGGDPWLFSIYLGALFPIFARFAWRGRRRFAVRLWSVAGAAAILIALGIHTPVFPWLFEHVPGLGAFRFPEKYFLITAFAGMLLSAFGAEGLREHPPTRTDALLGAAYIALPLALTVGLHLDYDGVREWALAFGNARMADDFGYAFAVWREKLLTLALLAGLAVFLVWVRHRDRLSRRWFGWLLCAVTASDLVVAHRDLNPVAGIEFYEAQPLILRHVPLEEVRRDYRYRSTRFDEAAGAMPIVPDMPIEAQKWLWQQIMAPNAGQPCGVLQQDAWDAIRLRRSEDERALHRVLDGERRWRLLRLQSVRYVYSAFALAPGAAAREIPLDSLPGHLYELADPLPRAYVARAVERVADDVEAINRVLATDFDPASTVVLPAVGETPASPARGGAGPETAAPRFPGASIIESSPRRVRVRLDVSEAGHLVLTDSWYPGWSARVDGEARPLERANHFFRAVAVGAGDRDVVFEYASPAYRSGRLASLVFLAAGLAFVVGPAARRRLGVERRAPPGASARASGVDAGPGAAGR